jgi:hypothetical protein
MGAHSGPESSDQLVGLAAHKVQISIWDRKDGNTFLVGIVLTAISKRALKDAEPTYLAILNGYK